MIDLKKELSIISSKIGKSPRKFSWYERHFLLKCSLPQWDWENDGIANTIKNWQKILESGELAWAQIIQANSLMFSKGKNDSPGELIICKNNCSFEKLEKLAQSLFLLKGQSKNIKNEEEKKFAIHLEDEITCNFGLKIPETICKDKGYFVSVGFFQRKHLPKRKISNGFLPVFYSSITHEIVIVPKQYWSKEFKKWWNSN